MQNTVVWGSVAELLTSCLTGLDSTKQVNQLLILRGYTTGSFLLYIEVVNI